MTSDSGQIGVDPGFPNDERGGGGETTKDEISRRARAVGYPQAELVAGGERDSDGERAVRRLGRKSREQHVKHRLRSLARTHLELEALRPVEPDGRGGTQTRLNCIEATRLERRIPVFPYGMRQP